MTTARLAVPRALCSDDIAVWPDETWTSLGDIWNSDYHFMSDDYEVVALEDEARLKDLGVEVET